MSSNMNTRNTKVMNRFDVTSRLIGKLKHEEAVIGGIGNTNFDLWAAGHRPQNFYMLGSMGLAFPIALGVALAQPSRRVFALEGDGSLLMQLGSLSTRNLAASGASVCLPLGCRTTRPTETTASSSMRTPRGVAFSRAAISSAVLRPCAMCVKTCSSSALATARVTPKAHANCMIRSGVTAGPVACVAVGMGWLMGVS